MTSKRGVRLKSLLDIRRFMARIANQLNRDVIDAGKARTLAYICSIMASIVKDADLETRIDALEKTIKKKG